MKKLTYLMLTLLIPAVVNAQFFSGSFKVSMQPPVKVDVELRRSKATIGFNRNDILEEYQKLKKEYKLNQYDSADFEKAIAFINASSKKITVEGFPERKPELASVYKLLQIRVAAGLLLAGKAEVIRKGSKVPEAEIIWRQLIPDPAEGGQYKFAFIDETEFFVGRQYGVFTPILEEVADDDTQPVDSKTTEVPIDDSNKVFYAVEIQPVPTNGLAEFNKYVNENLKYPQNMIRLGVEGTVFVKFIVNTDGMLDEFQIMKGVNADLDKEAIRVLKAGGAWKPGMQSGRIVRSQYVYPVRFKLPER